VTQLLECRKLRFKVFRHLPQSIDVATVCLHDVDVGDVPPDRFRNLHSRLSATD
jgi:hypothetical protein